MNTVLQSKARLVYATSAAMLTLLCRTSFSQLVSLPAADALLLLCDQGLYRSRNGGDSWEKISTQNGGSLIVHAGDGALTLWMRADELWGSRDQGTMWSRVGDCHAVRLPNLRRP